MARTTACVGTGGCRGMADDTGAVMAVGMIGAGAGTAGSASEATIVVLRADAEVGMTAGIGARGNAGDGCTWGVHNTVG